MSNHGVATVHGLLGHMELSYTQAQATAKAAVAIDFLPLSMLLP